MALQSIVPQLKLILWSYGEAYSNSGTNAKVKTSDRGPNDVLLYHIVLTFIKLFPVWRTETSLVIWDGIDLYLYTIYIYIAIIQYIYIVCVYIYVFTILTHAYLYICIYTYIYMTNMWYAKNATCLEFPVCPFSCSWDTNNFMAMTSSSWILWESDRLWDILCHI